MLRTLVFVVALLASGPAVANACNAPLFEGDLFESLWSLLLWMCCATVLLGCAVLGVGQIAPRRFRAATLVLSSCGALFAAAVCTNLDTAPKALFVLLVLTTFASAIAALLQWQSLKDP